MTHAGLKEVVKKVKVLNKNGDLNQRTKKGKDKTNAAKESSSDGKSDESIAFINYDSVAFIKDSTGATVIIDTGASRHIVVK